MSVIFSRSLENSFLLQFAQTLEKQLVHSAATDKDFGDCYLNISTTEKLLICVLTTTCSNPGIYFFQKLFKERVDGECYLDQRFTLTASEFHQWANKKEIIGMQTGAKEEDVMPFIKRERPSNNQFSKIPRLCSSGIDFVKFFI